VGVVDDVVIGVVVTHQSIEVEQFTRGDVKAKRSLRFFGGVGGAIELLGTVREAQDDATALVRVDLAGVGDHGVDEYLGDRNGVVRGIWAHDVALQHETARTDVKRIGTPSRNLTSAV